MVNKTQDLAADAKDELNKRLGSVKDSYNDILDESVKRTINGVKTTKEPLKV